MSQNGVALFRSSDLVPVHAEFEQYLLGVLTVFGRPRGKGRRLVELHRRGNDSVLFAVVVDFVTT
ncbi:hypothetical protein X011_09490 [Mycobacterium tuberculosis variant microti OV254]|nr:hypothetical protein X011_09490 [Mycobacterium tuberculosis variant microti OV254]